VFVKVLVLGDSCVGKTSLVARWRGEKFSSKYKETEGSSFTQRKSTFEGWMITICCWDIGGGSRFVEYLHGSHAVIICYDTTSFASLGKAKKICRDVSAEVPGIVPIIVGTKTDLAEDRKVEEGLGDTFAHEVGGMHLETSAAKDPSSCESAFFHVMKSLQSLGRLKDLPKTPEGFM
jgi:small GTP-binding protein